MSEGPEAQERHAMLRALTGKVAQLNDNFTILRTDLISTRREVHQTAQRVAEIETGHIKKSWGTTIKEQLWIIVPSFSFLTTLTLALWRFAYDDLIDQAREDMGIDKMAEETVTYRREQADWAEDIRTVLNEVVNGNAEMRADIARSLGEDTPISITAGYSTEPIYENTESVEVSFVVHPNEAFRDCDFTGGAILFTLGNRAPKVVYELRPQRKITRPTPMELLVTDLDELRRNGLLPAGRLVITIETFYDCDGRTVSDEDVIRETRVREIGDRASLGRRATEGSTRD